MGDCARAWLSIRLPWPPWLHLCVWLASPSNRRLSVPPFAPWTLLHFVARTEASDFRCSVGCPSRLRVVLPYPWVRGDQRISRVPGSAVVTCYGLGPR